MGRGAIGFVCRFCKTTVKTTVPATATQAEAGAALDALLEVHLTGHVDDFLYGEGGVFSGPLAPGGGPLRPADPPA